MRSHSKKLPTFDLIRYTSKGVPVIPSQLYWKMVKTIYRSNANFTVRTVKFSVRTVYFYRSNGKI